MHCETSKFDIQIQAGITATAEISTGLVTGFNLSDVLGCGGTRFRFADIYLLMVVFFCSGNALFTFITAHSL